MRDYVKECIELSTWTAADIARLYEPSQRRLPQRQRRAGQYLRTLSTEERKAVKLAFPTLRALLAECEKKVKDNHYVY